MKEIFRIIIIVGIVIAGLDGQRYMSTNYAKYKILLASISHNTDYRIHKKDYDAEKGSVRKQAYEK
jgi:hypothetical protein